MPLRSPFAAAAAVCALLTGCGSQVDGAATDHLGASGTTQPGVDETRPPSSSSSGTPPESYTYVLTSSCGERGLLGDYDVVVDSGKVVSAESLTDAYPYEPDLSEVPTLADLLAKAQSAPPRAIVEFTLDDAGLPKSLSLDPVPNGIDDEECYRVTRLRVIESGMAGPNRSVASGGGVQPVRVRSVVVSVPDTWVSTPNGCEGVLGGAIHLHAPGTKGTKTCGGVPSLDVVSTDRALGQALIDYPLDERAINGIRVRVGDSCLPTAACVFPYGLLAYLPADDIVLVVSAGSMPDMALARRIVASIRPPTT